MSRSDSDKNTKNSGRPSQRKTVTGRVISDKMDKTVSVLVYRLVRHPKYKKYMRRKSVFKAHDEKNQAKEGDKVQIASARPLSKTKRWRLLQILDSQGQGSHKYKEL